MKTIKQLFITLIQTILLIALSIGLTSCPGDETDFAINFYNNSSKDIYIFFGYPTGDKGEPIYPDTMITKDKDGRLTNLIKKNGGFVHYMYRHFKGQPSVYHLYVFDADTINTYSWEEIREGYKVLKRYDLNVENGLKEFKSLITYPPSESMKDVPMYPPYQ